MIAKLGLKALLAGSLSNLMSAALAGLILSVTNTAPANPMRPATPVVACCAAAHPAPAASANGVAAQPAH
jgi:CNT family concentrative nucleoside transporter